MTTAPPAPVDGVDDATLAQAAASGDRCAFAAIYDRYADRLHDFCIGMLRDRDAAADCVQDVFVTAATRLPQLREPGRLRSWLYAIARNEALARIRHRRREQPSDELPEIASGEPDLETLAARSELADLISEACGGLTERDRVVLELAYRHGLDGPELAEALGVTHKNANTLVERVRVTIERSLGALLVCRRVKADPSRCPELAALIDHWDGQFTVLMRKRAARHIESCPVCDDERARMVNPVALLGSVPVFLPAPAWLREDTLTQAGNVFPPSTAAPATPAGTHDPASGATAPHSAQEESWWPPEDLDVTDIDLDATGIGGIEPALSASAVLRSASERPATASTNAEFGGGPSNQKRSVPADGPSGYLGRHARAVLGAGLMIVGVGGAVVLTAPAIYRVDPTSATVQPAPTTATTTPVPITNSGPTGPTVPASTTFTTAPSTTHAPGPTGPTVPSTTSTAAPSTTQDAESAPTAPSTTDDLGPSLPTRTTKTVPPEESTEPPLSTPTTPKPTSQPPTKRPLIIPTRIPDRDESSDSCPPNTVCPNGPLS
jgi:RNA polymerase sigma factor (sigma-70 family)